MLEDENLIGHLLQPATLSALAGDPDDNLLPGDRSWRPLALIQKHFGMMAPQTPWETVTRDTPPADYSAVDVEKANIDIDLYLGCYDPETRTITIYIRPIEHFAAQLGITPKLLEMFVRLHEYAHAAVHLCNAPHKEEWATFLKQRIKFFRSFDRKTHELLAQAISYSLVDKDERPDFLTLMAKQPADYRLDPSILGMITAQNVAILLKGIQSAPEDLLPQINCKLRDVLPVFLKKASA